LKKLVIFDIDGTLIDSSKIDGFCYIQSIKDEFGITSISEDWSIYKSATDSMIFEEIFLNSFGKKPKEEDIKNHIKRFVSLLDEYSKGENSIKEIPGANNILNILREREDWRISIATGGWRESAHFKLKKANIDFKDIPFSTATDRMLREEIVSHCIEQSKEYYHVNRFEKIVSVGDAFWDLTTAHKLQLNFIGIDENNKFKDFPDCLTLKNYDDSKRLLDYLKDSKIPA
jgi:phosphoglycolate phosphatase-like HAD superfamily hydrolase